MEESTRQHEDNGVRDRDLFWSIQLFLLSAIRRLPENALVPTAEVLIASDEISESSSILDRCAIWSPQVELLAKIKW